MEKFLSPEEAGQFLGGVPERTVRQFVKEGLVPAYRVGRRFVLRPRDLRDFVERHPIKADVAVTVA